MKKDEIYNSLNHQKFSLKVHIIFCVKYRHKLLQYRSIDTCIKTQLNRAQTIDFRIEVIETDLDHVHMMIDYNPKVQILAIVRRLKQISTYDVWQKYDLSKFLWKEKTFWQDGYFACSIGNASADTIRAYIENQG